MIGKTNDLKFVFRFTFGIFLVLFLILLHFLHHMALPVTMHLWLASVLAQVFGYIIPVKLVIHYNKQLIERLHQHAKKH